MRDYIRCDTALAPAAERDGTLRFKAFLDR
jgi:hypothetical protein